MDNGKHPETDTKTVTLAEAKRSIQQESIAIEVKLMSELDINIRQLFFLKLMWYKMYPSLYEYLKTDAAQLDCSHAITRKETEDLFEKGLIDGPWYSSSVLPDLIEVNEKTSKRLAKAYGFTLTEIKKVDDERQKYYEMAKLFYEKYPDTGEINGREFMTKTPGEGFIYQGKTLYTEEDVYQCYLESINYDESLHEEIMELILNPAVIEKFLVCKIYKFVINKGYISLRKIKAKLDEETNWLNLSTD